MLLFAVYCSRLKSEKYLRKLPRHKKAAVLVLVLVVAAALVVLKFFYEANKNERKITRETFWSQKQKVEIFAGTPKKFLKPI